MAVELQDARYDAKAHVLVTAIAGGIYSIAAIVCLGTRALTGKWLGFLGHGISGWSAVALVVGVIFLAGLCFVSSWHIHKGEMRSRVSLLVLGYLVLIVLVLHYVSWKSGLYEALFWLGVMVNIHVAVRRERAT